MTNQRKNNQTTNRLRNILGATFAFLVASGIIGGIVVHFAVKGVEEHTVMTLNPLELDSPYSLEKPSKEVKLPTSIITNGHKLSLKARKFSGATTTIKSFKEKKALAGKNGDDGRFGASGQSGNQHPGEGGQNGGDGTNGATGFDSDLIYIKAEVIDVPLTIINNA